MMRRTVRMTGQEKQRDQEDEKAVRAQAEYKKAPQFKSSLGVGRTVIDDVSKEPLLSSSTRFLSAENCLIFSGSCQQQGKMV